jgi:hypothetical protein
MRNKNSYPPKPMTLRQHFLLRNLPIAVGLWLLAAITRWWIAPHLMRLPADYAAETFYQAQSRSRQTPDGEWENTPMIARRVDQALIVAGDTAILQGGFHWATEKGQVLFESAGIYGVDRRKRTNVSGYGNVNRTGLYLFPPHLQRTTYSFWDPMYIGPRVATFDRTDTLDGLPVYIFRFKVRNLDETPGYSYLPDVPERFKAYTDGQGTLWIEPLTGTIVDYQDQGTSYFFDARTAKRVADLFVWSEHMMPQTKAAQWKLAVAARRRTLALEVWLPAALLLGGLMYLALGWRAVPTSYQASTGSDL